MPGTSSDFDGNLPEAIFVDTNVILYSFDSREPAKQEKAHAWLKYLWQRGAGRLSWQVLNEFYVNAVRKTSVAPAEAREAVLLFSQWKPVGFGRGVLERGWHWMDHAQLSYWDSLILASAEKLGCGILLSEDFQTGRHYGSVRVINPFEMSAPPFSESAE